MRKRLGELLLLAATVTALGCSEKDATKCQEALEGTVRVIQITKFFVVGKIGLPPRFLRR